MKHIIIGTAGHVDHGKTSLIKHLTGIDTDRWEEEKRRGLTIDLGFAYFELPNGKIAGIIDVPGHEKFLKNMLAGIGGIDLVLLVIAANEGVMPQTIEHLDILKLLKIQHGIVVLTKIDLVDEELLELVIEEIKEVLKGSFLEKSPIIPVSVVTNKGIDCLIKKINEEITNLKFNKEVDSYVRMPIDRVFTKIGFGTIITGTLLKGKIYEGDNLEILPQKKIVRIRTIQVHDKPKSIALAGQRVALSLVGVEVKDIKRGDVITSPNTLTPSKLIDVKLDILPNIPFPSIKNNTRIKVYLGTSEVIGRIRILDGEEIKAGSSSYCQIIMESLIVCDFYDRFVVRLYSPLVTIGGGVVLNPYSKRKKKKNFDSLLELEEYEKRNYKEIVLKVLSKKSCLLFNIEEFKNILPKDVIGNLINELIEQEVLIRIDSKVIRKDIYEDLKNEIFYIIEEYNVNYPRKIGISKQEIQKNKNIPLLLLENLLEKLIFENKIKQVDQLYSTNKHITQLNKEEDFQYKKIIDLLQENKFLSIKELNEIMKIKPEILNDLIQFGIYNNTILCINQDIIMEYKYFNIIKIKLIDYLKQNSYITVSEFKNLINTSRKYAVPIIEYCDKIGLTKRLQDKRILCIK